MANVIATNVASINAQRSLFKTGQALSVSFQRLSSGLRINSARDDAAGLQISNKLTSQINGLNVAVRNANDGISMAQTAEGALQETTNILQRMRDLAIQSANGSNSIDERKALQAEVTQLIKEVDRIANTTRFGGRTLLNGSLKNVAFQVGAQANETISLSIASARAADLGKINDVTFAGFSLAAASQAATPISPVTNQQLTVVLDNKSTSFEVSAGSSAQDIQDLINSNVSGLQADAKTSVQLDVSGLVSGNTIDITLNGISVSSITASTDAADGKAIKDAIEADARFANLTVTDQGNGVLNIVDESGEDIVFDDITVAQGSGASTGSITFQALDYNGGTVGTATTLTSGNGIYVTGDIKFTGTAKSGALYSSDTSGGITTAGTQAAGNGTFTLTPDNVSTIDITTVDGAQTAINVIDAAITQIDSNRGDLGAVQNRLSST
ncbi:MAG: flagellin, partial [Chloroflexi bacterium]